MHFQQQDLFGGKGIVEIESLLPKGSFPFSAVLWCSLEANGSVGAHRQQRDPEIVLCVQGQGVVTVNGVVYPFSPKKMVFVPYSAVLSIENSSAIHPLEYLIIKAEISHPI
jgi:quercetin dioxygenase-like cupin family protein